MSDASSKVIIISPETPRAGRPALYDESYCAMVIEYMAKNHSLTAFAGLIRVAPRTIQNWVKQHPEFKEAVEIGRAARIGEIEERMNKEKISGPQAMLMWKQATNVAPDEYADKMKIEGDGDNPHGSNVYLKEIADSIAKVCDSASQALERSRNNARIAIQPEHEIIEADYTDITDIKKGPDISPGPDVKTS